MTGTRLSSAAKIRRFAPIRAATVLLLALAAPGCGTAVYSHQVAVSVSDPANRLGAAPFRMGFFDWRLGSSLEYALKNGGEATTSTPYESTTSTMATALVFSAPRPDSLELSLALPALTTNGFFHLHLHPQSIPAGDSEAFYQLFDGVPPAGDGPKLRFRYSAEPLDKGWRLKIELIIPPS